LKFLGKGEVTQRERGVGVWDAGLLEVMSGPKQDSVHCKRPGFFVHVVGTSWKTERKGEGEGSARAREREISMSEPAEEVKVEEEPTESPEERLAWLRARGVTVETVEDRKLAKEGKLDPNWGQGQKEITFKYVKIPWDDTQPYEEIETKGYVAQDCMLTLMKPVFAGGNIDSQTAKKTALAQMGQSVQTAGLDHLGEAAQGGTVETFALVRPAKTNSQQGVYIYLDEVGMLKQLPKNPRASSLAATCGFNGADFFGDVYVGRVQCQPSPMYNIDFTVKDLDSSAAWMKRAAAENYDYGLGMAELRDKMGDQLVGGGQPAEDEGTIKEGDGYTWSQGEEDVEITVDGGEGIKSSQVKAVFKPASLKLTVAGETK